jgi:YaiO family outer membrane protein
MLLSLLLMATLDAQAAPPQPAAPPPARQVSAAPPPSHTEAAALADAGDLDASLRAFQRIAAANPHDHVARIRIADLQMALHRPERAEPVYRSILLEDPMNVQARVGVGASLTARRAYDDALDVLEPAEKEAPENPELLAALGEAYEGLGHAEDAIEYYERAIAIAPTKEHKWRLERVRRSDAHRIEGTGLLERFDQNAPDTRGFELGLNLRLTERLRVLARGQRQEKFDLRDTRGGGGAEWRLNRSTSLLGEFMAGPDDRVLARYETYGQLTYVRDRAQWRVGYRYLDFLGATASILGPSVKIAATNRFALDLGYLIVISDYFSAPTDTTPSAWVRAEYDLTRRVSVMGGYSRGIENFQAISIDRVRPDFNANTVSAGAAAHFPSLTSVFGIYEYQRRPDGFTMSRFTVSFGQRF